MPTAPRRTLARLARRCASAAWPLVAWHARALERPSPSPAWAPAPLLKRREKSRPPLGFPRRTDSLCPGCVKEVRRGVLSGDVPVDALRRGSPGAVEAQIVERDGEVWMEKSCAVHGPIADLMSVDAQFLRRIEELFPGRDFAAPMPKLRDHGASSIQYGRGAVLTVDLTNRCNMMCDPCFMDANQVGYVHEPSWSDIAKILDDAADARPRRQMSVQFSGGEPTLSPLFLDAVRYAREKGYFAVQCATNGIRFAEDPAFAREARAAGLRMAYLQFDGIGEEANRHRKVGNLFDVKLRAIENLHAAGVDVILVVTVVRGVNDAQVGPVLRFAIDNADKITVVSFQPVSFTGRDEDIDDATRTAQRYTLSHLARDVQSQLGLTDPMRDWFPLSALTPFSDVTDVLLGESATWGSVSCGCHPNCGIGTMLLVHKETKETVALCDVLDLEQLLDDVSLIADSAQPRPVVLAQLATALVRSFRPERAPRGFGVDTLVRQFLSQTGSRGRRIGEFESDASEFEWRVLFVAGMWFQDLFNYDFRRTEMCIIPYGTQEGEISFCAYNTGVGWRQIVEQMRRTATVAEWYRAHGRHPVYAKHQDVAIAPSLGTVTVRDGDGRRSLRVMA